MFCLLLPIIFALAFPCIILVLALLAAKLGVRMLRQKRHGALIAAPYRPGFVRQHEAEHHLDAEQQRMEIPYNGRLVVQGNPISGRDAAKSRNAVTVQPLCVLVQKIIH